MPSKLSVTATFLFAYFLCDSTASANLVELNSLLCDFGSNNSLYRKNAYVINGQQPSQPLTVGQTAKIITCNPATDTNCNQPTGIKIKCTENGWAEEPVHRYNLLCNQGYFLNKDDFTCYKCTDVTGNNYAIVRTSDKTNTAQDCYIPSSKKIENDRGYFNYDRSCYYAGADLNNANGINPFWDYA